MHRRHQTFSQPERIVDHLGDGRKAIGRAGGVGNDPVLGRIEFVVVHAHQIGGDFFRILGGGGNDDALAAGFQMIFSAGVIGEQAGRFDDVIRSQLGPRQLGRVLDRDGRHEFSIDDDAIAPGLDRALVFAMRRVVLEEIGVVVGRK